MRKLFTVGQQDLGDGQVLCQWSPRGSWLAAAGNKRVVLIYDHTGKLHGEIHLAPVEAPTADTRQCCCLQLQWDASAEMLAVLPAGCSFVYIWTAATKELQKLETDFKAQEATMLSWSNCSAVLAVSTVKGNLQLYFIKERRKMPVVAKHTKRVCTGAWGLNENILALAALDKTVTISNLSGDTLKTLEFKGDPLQLCAAVCKDERPGSAKSKEAAFSLITSKRALYVIQGPKDPAIPPMELTFMETYGPMTQHLWFGDGYIMLGFRSGQVVVVSSLSKEVSREIHSHRPLDMLQDMAYCPAVSRVAVGGGSTIKLLDVGAEYGEVSNEAMELPVGHMVNKLGWGQDGQVLTVGTANGLLITYLASLPMVFAAAGTKHAMLISLGEMTVHDVIAHTSTVIKVDCEPSFCSLGPCHLAVGLNNQVLFYSHASSPGELVNGRSYLGGVQAVCLNATYAAVLTDGRVLLHSIDGGSTGQHGSDTDLCLPQPGAARPEPITCMALSHHFLITATAAGTVCHHMVREGALALVNEYRHPNCAIVRLIPQPFGPKLVCADDRMNVGLFSPLADELTHLPGFDGNLEQLLWDEEDPNLFVATNSRGQMYTYLLPQLSLSGQQLELLATVSLPVGYKPVLLADGRLSVRLKSGAVDTWVLETHKPLLEHGGDAKQLQKRLAAAIKLRRLPESLDAARALGSTDAWRQVAAAALQQLDVRLAVAAYRQAGDTAMVMSLSGLTEVEDRHLLAGSLMVLLEQDVNQAQELLLRSSRPIAALEMRQDLKHWPEALALAQRLAPERVPALSKEHAAMLEMVGEHAEARAHYQQALDVLGSLGGDPQLQQACMAGMARILLHLGDLRGGKALAQQLNNTSLWKECAGILEQMHQGQEAAEMYELVGLAEKAAGIYIAARNWGAAAPLMQKVTSAKLQLQYAKAKEKEGSYSDAVAAYEAAGDLDSGVRLSLEKLGELGRAAALARKSRSMPAAALVARAALATGDVPLAVEFLLLAGQLDQAFDLAAAKWQLEIFGQLAASSVKAEDDAVRLAQYLEGRGQPEQAADFWIKASQAERAISLYAQACSPGSLTKAIKALEDGQCAQSGPVILAALDRCSPLEAHVRDTLRLRLNMAAGQLADAARDALELARREQEEGNYKLAHAKMFSTLQQLQAMGAAAPLEFRQALALLHSYVLVKSLLAVGDHMGAARMLVRVAGNISRFPKHVVPILTSTVIECQRAGLKKTALEYACTLMRPEYRSEVSDKYKKKIELMVRKPDRGDEPQEGLSPCPFCHLPGPETQLQCVSCQSIIPCDIATGKRMTLQDWCECPSCHMPCSSQPFLAVLAAEGKCPMCSAAVSMHDVRQVVHEPLRSTRWF